jgi:hypothetical protein
LNIKKNIIIVIIVTLKTIIDMIGALFGSLFVKYVIGNNANLGANVSKIEQGINERSVNLVVDQSYFVL